MFETAAQRLIARLNEAAPANLPIHPRTGLSAIGFTSRGPIWPVAGGSQPAPPAAVSAVPAPPAGDPPAAVVPAVPGPAPVEPKPEDPPEDKTDWKAEARKWEERAKENRDKAKKLDDLEAANATELEKAQKAADDAAAQVKAANERAVRAEIKALADGFADKDDAALNLRESGGLERFLTDSGDVDADGIKTALEGVLKAKPHLAVKKPDEPPPAAPGAGGRPVEQLRPGAAPTAPARARSLEDAVNAQLQSPQPPKS
ncbi:MAG: hypothetical protein JO222_09330 [Frankiales bacterium]|nr:hypothetical protein [Frankiales bacterium]